jgi:hypothetical protein
VPSPCTVTGNLQNLSAGKISQGIVIFELANIGTGNPLGIIGTSLFPLLRYQIQSAPDGSFTTSFRGNDSINPVNTIYDNVTYRDSLGNSVGPLQYSIIGASANLNTLVAATTTSPPVLTVGSGFTLLMIPPLVVPFSATPTFNAATQSVFQITLSGNVTSSTLSALWLGSFSYFASSKTGRGDLLSHGRQT